MNTPISEATPAQPRSEESSGAPRRQRRWKFWLPALIGAAVLAGVFGYCVNDHVREDQQFNTFHATLDTTQHHVNYWATELSELRQAVGALRSQVATNSATWGQDSAQLSSASSALAITQADISQQGSRIGDLHTCLGGVQQALNALAINDQPGAVSALSAVSSSCHAASGT